MVSVKRVLLAAGSPDLSGVSTVARHLAAGLRRHGVEARLWFSQSGPGLVEFQAHGLPVAVHPSYGLPFLGRRTVALARQWAPDLVHAQSPETLGRARRLSRSLRRPLAVTVHRCGPACTRALSRAGDAGVVAVSDVLRERLANEDGVPRDRLAVIRNALDMALFPRPAFAPRERAGGRVPAVGACGTLAEGKGRDVFLRMAARLLAQGVDAEFVLLGEGPAARPLRALAEKLGIRQRVSFGPFVHPGQLAGLDVLAEPSTVEGLGHVALQAMALGVPVAAVGAGGLFDLVADGVTGLLVPPGDDEGLARAVRRLLEDPVGSLNLARQARDRVEESFDADKAAQAMLAFYAREAARQAGTA